MPADNNENPTNATRVRAALIADNRCVKNLVAAVRAAERFELVAQAGMDRQAAAPDVDWFDDIRAPIAQSRAAAVLIAGSTRQAVEAGRLAFEHGVHAWRIPPLGRDFAETLELVRRSRSARVILHASSWAEGALGEPVTSIAREPGYAELCVRARGPGAGDWRCTKHDAGGGVLAHDAYPWLELAVRLRGLPEWAQCALAHARGAAGQPPRETEAVAVAILRYESGAMLHAHASWDVPPFESSLTCHGRQASVRVTPERCTLLDLDGHPADDTTLPDRPVTLDLMDFADQVLSGHRPEQFEHALETHVAVAAITEAAYLSSRTGQLESPGKLYEVHRWPQPVP
jgi:predicted dehydrogenase